jgi:hypothetical protein
MLLGICIGISMLLGICNIPSDAIDTDKKNIRCLEVEVKLRTTLIHVFLLDGGGVDTVKN